MAEKRIGDEFTGLPMSELIGNQDDCLAKAESELHSVLIVPRFRKMLLRTLIIQKIILNTLLVRTCTTNRCSRSVNRINPHKSTGTHTRISTISNWNFK